MSPGAAGRGRPLARSRTVPDASSRAISAATAWAVASLSSATMTPSGGSSCPASTAAPERLGSIGKWSEAS